MQKPAIDMRIAVCDDEEAQIRLTQRNVHEWADARGVAVEVETFSQAQAFWFAHQGGRPFDLAFLDIQMPGQTGMELAYEMRAKDDPLAIVFITGLTEHIQEGYDVSAVHYLIKPYTQERLFACLDRVRSRVHRTEPVLLIQEDGVAARLLQRDIIYAEVYAHDLIVHAADRDYTFRGSITELEQRLDRWLFIRCHRAYLAGLAHVKQMQKDELCMDNGQKLPVSRRMAADVSRAFVSFYRKEPI